MAVGLYSRNSNSGKQTRAATIPPHYADRIDRRYLQRGMSKGLGFRGTKRRRRREESDDANCELWNVCIPDAADGRRKREWGFGGKGFHNEPAATATRRPQAGMQELLLPYLPSNADQANGKKKLQEVFSSGIDITPLESLSSQEEEMEAMSQEPQTIDLSSCSDSDDYGSDNCGITKKTRGNHAEMQSLDAENTALFRNVLDVIEEGGDLKKLKVDDLKTYLRYYGLRMIGNKATLIERIQEHLVVKDGGGEAKYRRSMFSLNCTGDVVQGDVVLFEQKVYHSYDFVSRSAAGPPLGKRMVAGCVVSDSYGATKQQHTFTIEVLWSTGVQPLPAMYPLQIKGRNLYRLRTYRQPWLNEEDRQSALVEKHGRGVAARNIRAAAKAQHSHLRSKGTAPQEAEHMRVTRGQVQRSFTRTPENTVAGLHSNAGHHIAEKRHCYVPEVAPPSTSSSWSHNPPKSPISTLRGHSAQVTNSFGTNIQHYHHQHGQQVQRHRQDFPEEFFMDLGSQQFPPHSRHPSLQQVRSQKLLERPSQPQSVIPHRAFLCTTLGCKNAGAKACIQKSCHMCCQKSGLACSRHQI